MQEAQRAQFRAGEETKLTQAALAKAKELPHVALLAEKRPGELARLAWAAVEERDRRVADATARGDYATAAKFAAIRGDVLLQEINAYMKDLAGVGASGYNNDTAPRSVKAKGAAVVQGATKNKPGKAGSSLKRPTAPARTPPKVDESALDDSQREELAARRAARLLAPR